MEIEEGSVVVLNGQIATGLDFLGGKFDFVFDHLGLLVGEIKEAGEALHGAGLPVTLDTGFSDDGRWGTPGPAFLLAGEKSHPVSAEEDGQEGH